MLCEKVYFHILFSSYLIFLKILKENMYTMELILLPNKGSKIQSYCFFRSSGQSKTWPLYNIVYVNTRHIGKEPNLRPG
uniref:Uncharacterized protein n=1 Tax=Siphoviridae sp. ctoyo6 TaxID=2825674 RepID=A0A8S5U370_9CAUD|nr:MAG TPA: hypothetical protein [Siphoviridae sp. ctoyo6]